MIDAARIADPTLKPSHLTLHLPTGEITNSARWLINGFPATIVVWTAEEWSRLIHRPDDAQPVPNGTWCALRID